MDWKLLIITFVSIFLAELGDKTQLSIIAFASSGKSPIIVFLGSALASIVTSLLGVLVGAGLQKLLPTKIIHIVAGIIFFGIGIYLIVKNITS
ncbi:MAG: TMEM165/GDT1 family protein [candidate division WOR-3 bacterium]